MQDFVITRIEIYNRVDCCSERLSNAKVSFLNAAAVPKYEIATIGDMTNKPAIAGNIARTEGIRRVRIELPGRQYLSLAEVKLFGVLHSKQLVNIAVDKPCTQSSVWYDNDCRKANDGFTSGNINHHSVMHTNLSGDNWWKVDLGGEYNIDSVTIYNRSDCCQSRLADSRAVLYDGNDQMIAGMVVPANFNGDRWAASTGPYKTRKVRYVEVAQYFRQDYMNIAEVEVWVEM